ncbi:MAG: hypothetical protein ABSC76_02385 [Terracidiphilus sp.]|jgi:hypothetical protein
MRFAIPAVLVFLSVTTVPMRASGFDDKVFDQQSIDLLAAKASQAQPREQCFLYAELVHEMTEFSVQKYAAGDVEKAAELLRQIQGLTHKIHLAVAEDSKRTRNTEILLRHTAFRLTGLLHSSSFEDQSLVAETLAQVNQVQNEAMMQVFRK